MGTTVNVKTNNTNVEIKTNNYNVGGVQNTKIVNNTSSVRINNSYQNNTSNTPSINFQETSGINVGKVEYNVPDVVSIFGDVSAVNTGAINASSENITKPNVEVSDKEQQEPKPTVESKPEEKSDENNNNSGNETKPEETKPAEAKPEAKPNAEQKSEEKPEASAEQPQESKPEEKNESKSEEKPKEEKPTNSQVDASKYKSNSSFEVTTGNKTYNLSEREIDFLAAVVESEGANDHNKDEALAVVSVILNRADTAGFANDPVSVCKQSGQFEGYYGGSYNKYLNSNGSFSGDPKVRQAVVDALNGTRNNDYLYFVADGNYMSNGNYDNYITAKGGNRYSKTYR